MKIIFSPCSRRNTELPPCNTEKKMKAKLKKADSFYLLFSLYALGGIPVCILKNLLNE